MNRQKLFLTLISFIIVLSAGQMYGQSFLDKIKSKAEDKTVDKMFNGNSSSSSSSSSSKSSSTSSSSTNSNSTTGSKPMQNTKGNGLSNSTPDVKENIKSALENLQTKNYVDARYAIRQAIQGVELEIGQDILKLLPHKADGLPVVTTEDKVTSSGIGFVGLFIQRIYQNDSKELKVLVQNDAAQMAVVNMYLTSSSSSTTSNTADKNNSKQVKYKGYRALLQFNQSSGYTISIPFGQTSMLMVNGINYNDENSFLSAANEFDIEKIKTELGEK